MGYKPIRITPKSHDEWLKAREEGIGASEVATILGLNPWESPFQLYLRKTHQVPPTEENEAMLMGHLLEDAVAKRWEIETGEKVIKASAADIIYVHPEHPYMRVTPDRIVTGRKKLVECKTTNLELGQTIPDHWLCQTTYQMYVTGIHDCDLAYLRNGREFGIYHVAYDEALANLLAERVTDFWTGNVLKEVEPEPVNSADITTMFPSSDPGSVILADGDALGQWQELYEVNLRIKELEAEAESLKERLKVYMLDRESLVDGDGNVLISWKTGAGKASFDSKSFKADHPEMYAGYLRTVPGARTFLVKKPKERKAKK